MERLEKWLRYDLLNRHVHDEYGSKAGDHAAPGNLSVEEGELRVQTALFECLVQPPPFKRQRQPGLPKLIGNIRAIADESDFISSACPRGFIQETQLRGEESWA